MLVRCQSTDEILADKLISFANSPKAPRYRDLWDIPWIIGTRGWDTVKTAHMVELKHADYRCPQHLNELLISGRARAVELATSKEFSLQMQRLIPHASFMTTLGRPGYTEALGTRIGETYTAVLNELRLSVAE